MAALGGLVTGASHAGAESARPDSSQHLLVVPSTATGELALARADARVVARYEDFSREIWVELGPVPPGEDEPLYTTRFVTRFREHETLLVPVFLARRCETETCAEGACGEDGCEPVFRDPATLEEVEPGDELDDAP